MAVPKKKTSPSRRNNRRFSAANLLRPVNFILDKETGEPIRSHRYPDPRKAEGPVEFTAFSKSAGKKKSKSKGAAHPEA